MNIIVLGAHPDDCEADAGGRPSFMPKWVTESSLCRSPMEMRVIMPWAEGTGKNKNAEAQEAGKRLGVGVYGTK